MPASNDTIQFRGGAEKQASRLLDEMRLGGINISELAREGLKEKLRESLSREERITIHQQYREGDISEEVATVLIGDLLEEIEQERDAVRKANSSSRDGLFQQD